MDVVNSKRFLIRQGFPGATPPSARRPRRRRMRRYVCEMCQEPTRAGWATITTMCEPCHNAEDMVEKDIAKKAKAWARTHKCRGCKVGLPLERYFKCYACQPADRIVLSAQVEEKDVGEEDSE